MSEKAYLGFGSNVGNSVDMIEKAYQELEQEGIVITSKSSFYISKPYGNLNQNNFVNSVAEIETELKLEEFFILIKNLEKKLGRITRERWGPREIDIDILLYNNLVFCDDNIEIPHKEILKRDFVLIPLIEINRDLIIPGYNQKLKEIDFSRIESNIISKLQS